MRLVATNLEFEDVNRIRIQDLLLEVAERLALDIETAIAFERERTLGTSAKCTAARIIFNMVGICRLWKIVAIDSTEPSGKR